MSSTNPTHATAMPRRGLLRTTLAAALLFAMAGCMAPPAPPPAPQPMPTPDKISALRASYQQQAPGTLLGQVDAVRESDQLVAINDIPVQEFKEGDPVTFIDISSTIINHGHVVRTTPELVMVKYDSDGIRPPRKGDLMVRLK